MFFVLFELEVKIHIVHVVVEKVSQIRQWFTFQMVESAAMAAMAGYGYFLILARNECYHVHFLSQAPTQN